MQYFYRFIAVALVVTVVAVAFVPGVDDLVEEVFSDTWVALHANDDVVGCGGGKPAPQGFDRAPHYAQFRSLLI